MLKRSCSCLHVLPPPLPLPCSRPGLPDVQERLKTLGLDPVLSSPAELARYQATEITKWAKVVKDSGAKAQ